MVVHFLKFLALFYYCHGTFAAIQSPQFTMIYSGSEVEIRLYQETTWVSAVVRGDTNTSFEQATKIGFHRLYQYIHGANINSTRIAMTAPILTSILQAGAHGPNYSVRFYLPVKFDVAYPQPNPQLNLQFDKLRSHCIAVKKFPGFAKDDSIAKEVESLVTSLAKLLTGKPVVLEDKSSYSIAQYSAPFRVSARLNEVWINVSGFTEEGCRNNIY